MAGLVSYAYANPPHRMAHGLKAGLCLGDDDQSPSLLSGGGCRDCVIINPLAIDSLVSCLQRGCVKIEAD